MKKLAYKSIREGGSAMNIDLTQEELSLIYKALGGESDTAETDEKFPLLRKLSRYMPQSGHSPETETKEGIVDTSKNKNWKAP
jgi:hypothetical protein